MNVGVCGDDIKQSKVNCIKPAHFCSECGRRSPVEVALESRVPTRVPNIGAPSSQQRLVARPENVHVALHLSNTFFPRAILPLNPLPEFRVSVRQRDIHRMKILPSQSEGYVAWSCRAVSQPQSATRPRQRKLSIFTLGGSIGKHERVRGDIMC